MKTLIVKLNATGDVVRTTPLLRWLRGEITWVTAALNVPLLRPLPGLDRCIAWDDRETALDREYDLAISLEDEPEVGAFLARARKQRVFGAYVADDGSMRYTEDSQPWFDMSLISRFGRCAADQRKLANRSSYQELLFKGLGAQFAGEEYLLPAPIKTDLFGDVAIATVAGPVWPMKNWAYYDQLKAQLERAGLVVNILPRRTSLLEHLGDIGNHRCVVGGDSLPMHFALGMRVPCVTLFNCTSPWEIHGYGLQRQLISPLLAEFFYQRGMDPRATHAIGLEQVLAAVDDVLAGECRVERDLVSRIEAPRGRQALLPKPA